MSEERFLKGYDPRDYPPVAVTVDVVALTIRDGQLHVLLIQRGGPPYEGFWALPGGFVRPTRTSTPPLAASSPRRPASAARRCAACTWSSSAATATPTATRGCGSSRVAYLAFAPDLPEPEAGGDAGDAQWLPVAERPAAASPSTTTGSSPTGWSGPARSSSTPRSPPRSSATSSRSPSCARSTRRSGASALHAGNFHRKVLSVPGLVESTGATTERGGPAGRSAGPPLPRRRRPAAAPGAAAPVQGGDRAMTLAEAIRHVALARTDDELFGGDDPRRQLPAPGGRPPSRPHRHGGRPAAPRRHRRVRPPHRPGGRPAAPRPSSGYPIETPPIRRRPRRPVRRGRRPVPEAAPRPRRQRPHRPRGGGAASDRSARATRVTCRTCRGIVESFRQRDADTADERRVNVLAAAPGLRQPRRRYAAARPDGLDPRDVAWMWRRLLVALGMRAPRRCRARRGRCPSTC